MKRGLQYIFSDCFGASGVTAVKPEWRCSSCTFVNRAVNEAHPGAGFKAADTCEMCGLPMAANTLIDIDTPKETVIDQQDIDLAPAVDLSTSAYSADSYWDVIV